MHVELHRFHLTLVRMSIKKKTTTNAGEDLGRNVISAAIREINMGFLKKLKIGLDSVVHI